MKRPTTTPSSYPLTSTDKSGFFKTVGEDRQLFHEAPESGPPLLTLAALLHSASIAKTQAQSRPLHLSIPYLPVPSKFVHYMLHSAIQARFACPNPPAHWQVMLLPVGPGPFNLSGSIQLECPALPTLPGPLLHHYPVRAYLQPTTPHHHLWRWESLRWCYWVGEITSLFLGKRLGIGFRNCLG